jgi:hypothetical protein
VCGCFGVAVAVCVARFILQELLAANSTFPFPSILADGSNQADYRMIGRLRRQGGCDLPDIMKLAHQHKYEIHFAEHIAEWTQWFSDVLEDRALTNETGRDGATITRMFSKSKWALIRLSWKVSVADSTSMDRTRRARSIEM